jgi:hypothetical protein
LDNAARASAPPPQPGSAENAAVGEFGDLAWAWDARLALINQSLAPRERWRLEQAGRPVAAIERTTAGWSLDTPAEHWEAAVRRRRRRLGWHLEFTPAEAGGPVLSFYPHTLRPGGRLVLAQGGLYTLGRRYLLSSEWELAAVSGGALARITLWTRRPGAAKIYGPRAGLRPGAEREPHLMLLLGATCVALAIHHQQPRVIGPAP